MSPQIAVATVPGVADVRRMFSSQQLVPEGEGQTVQSGLGSGIHRLLGHRIECDSGYDVDNVPAALRPHDRQDGADTVDRPVEIQSERFLPVTIGPLVKTVRRNQRLRC